MDKSISDVWMFSFGLERQDGEPFHFSIPEKLIDLIVEWAEENELQVGGGYHFPRESD